MPCEHNKIALICRIPKEKNWKMRHDWEDDIYFAACYDCGTSLMRDLNDYEITDMKQTIHRKGLAFDVPVYMKRI